MVTEYAAPVNLIPGSASPNWPPGDDWGGPPFWWVGSNVAVDALVADAERLAVVLTALTVYPTGLVLRLEVHARKGLDLMRMVFEAPRMTEAMRQLEGEPPVDPDPFQLNVAYSDGRVARPFNWRAPDETYQPPYMVMQRGHGGSDQLTQTFWLHPLPVEGDLDLHYSWGSEGVADSVWHIPGDLVREAARRAYPLWSGR
jgi:hypothetical protein